MTTLAVEARDLGKRFQIYRRPLDRLLRPGTVRMKEHWALQHVDIAVPQGRCLGVIGVNGAGKSTLLKLLTGVIRPTEGSLALASPPLALLELGTGFNGELSGRENLFATGALLGYSAEAITARLLAIRDFADIGDYFDQPMKTYSSGMFVRVAFALYVNLDCEVLIIDEALGVGDFFFQQKCAAALRAIKQRGTTILFVSHDTAAVQEMADEAILLKQGRIIAHGDPNTVISLYFAAATSELSVTAAPTAADDDGGTGAAWTKQAGPDQAVRRRIAEICAGDLVADKPSIGVGGARLVALRILDDAGRPALTFRSGARARFEAVIEARQEIPFANFGVAVADEEDRLIWSAANSNQELLLGRMTVGDRALVSLDVALDLQPGTYHLNVSTGEFDPGDTAYSIWNDLKVRAIVLHVTPTTARREQLGLADIPISIAAR